MIIDPDAVALRLYVAVTNEPVNLVAETLELNRQARRTSLRLAIAHYQMMAVDPMSGAELEHIIGLLKNRLADLQPPDPPMSHPIAAALSRAFEKGRNP